LTQEQNENTLLENIAEDKMAGKNLIKNSFEFVVFGGVLATMVFWAEIVHSFTG